MRSALRSTLRLLAPAGLLLALLLPALAPAPKARAAPFTADNLVVYRVGAAGGGGVVDSGNPVFLDELTPAGAPVQSLPLPTSTSGANRPVFASDRPGEGLITRSADGRSLIVTGFSQQALGLPGSQGQTIPRVIAQVFADGSIVSSTAPRDYASTSVPTSAVSDNGFNFWAAGGAGGVRYTPGNTITSTQLLATPGSLNQLAIFEGQLYASAIGVGVGAVGEGLPVTAGQAIAPLPGLPATGVLYGFFLANLSPAVPGLDTLYVAYDDQGLRKFALVGGSWVARGTVGGDADDYRGLTATVSGQSVTLYATRGGRELVRLVDASGYGGSLTAAPALLATAPAGTAFRGVALAPRAATELRPDLTVTVSGPASARVGEAYSYAVSVRNSGVVAAAAISATFILPPGVTFLSASGEAGFTASHSAGVVTFGGGSLGVGGQADLLVSVAAAAGGPVTVAPGAAVVDPANTILELDETNNSSLQTVLTNVGDPRPDLTVTVSGPASATVGEAYSYAVSVRNPGEAPATGISVTFTLPPGVTYLDAAGGGFTASQSGGVVTFGGGSLGVGGQADLLVSVAAAAVGPVTVAPGSAVVDPANTILELDETNNGSPQTVVTNIRPVGGPPDDTTPPETTITARPPAVTTSRSASFSFNGQDDVTPAGGLGFQCSLDGAVFGPCASPRVYDNLGPGAHSFRVRAIDAAGNADPSPASYSWTVRARIFAPFVRR